MVDVSDVMMTRASEQLKQCETRLRIAINCLSRVPSGSRPRDWTPEIQILKGMRVGMRNMNLSIRGYMCAKQKGLIDDE